MKNLAFTFFTVLCMSLCFYSCGEDASDDPDMMEEEETIDYTIYPGKGIGTLNIGDPGSKVESELGEGFMPIVNVGGSGNATYNYYSDSKGMDIVFGQQSSGDLDINSLPIQRFDLFGDFEGMTSEGIGIGSSRADVIAAYGEPDEVDQSFGDVSVYYIGMVIDYDDMEKVRKMNILEI